MSSQDTNFIFSLAIKQKKFANVGGHAKGRKVKPSGFC